MHEDLPEGLRLQFGKRPRSKPAGDAGLSPEMFETGFEAKRREVSGWRMDQTGEVVEPVVEDVRGADRALNDGTLQHDDKSRHASGQAHGAAFPAE